MEFYIDDGGYGKCRKHPAQPLHGVCAVCLKDRLTMLCPDCAHLRPCGCCAQSDFTSSASSSSSTDVGIGSVAPMSFLINNEPSFQRSKSAAVGMFREKSSEKPALSRPPLPETRTKSPSSSFWSFLRSDKAKKKPASEDPSLGGFRRARSVRFSRSKSVGIACYADVGDLAGGGKGRGWHFPSPINVFRQSKMAKVVHQRSPLCRG